MAVSGRQPMDDARAALHQLNNALAALRMQAAVTRASAADPALAGDLARIEASAEQAAGAARALAPHVVGVAPAPAPAPVRRPEPPLRPVAEAHAPVVLVVDDDAVIRAVVTRVLTGEGYQVVAADRAEEAEAWLAAGREADALVCDVELPGRDGHWLVDRARELQPALPILVLSGHGASAAHPGTTLLPKPFAPAAFLAAVAEATGRGRRDAPPA
jgi:CheY-like chemotaxis protein